jgi:D-xylose transport system substrate-binding protein
MARGAVLALDAAGLANKHVFVAGADSYAANVKYVCEGKQAVEVLKEIKPLAEKAAEVAADLVAGKPVPGASPGADGVPVAAVPVGLVTPENAKAVIVESGFQPANLVPACAKGGAAQHTATN